MKVVINAYSARLGGGQTYLKNLLAHLPDDPSLQVRIFAPDALALPEDARIIRVTSAWPTQNPLLRAVWERFSLPSYLRRERADVLFCPGGVVATTPPPGCKVVSMFRNMIPFDSALVRRMPWGAQRVRNLLLRRVLLRSMSQADLTIFISNHARAVIESLTPIPNAVTIPHGISDAFRAGPIAPRRPTGAPAGDYLLYVSRFDIYKHHREVVEAFHRLPTALRDGVSLVFIGESDMPEAEVVRTQIASLGLVEQVKIIGAVAYEQLPMWYAHAKTVLFASSCENCPNILLEAMAAGRPVLSSDVMPMPEFGGDRLSYFSPFVPASLTAALIPLLADSAVRDRQAAASLARSRRYDWALTAGETWKQLAQLSGPSATR